MEFRKIVVGTDFSRSAEPAVAHALGIARRSGAEIVLVHVCPIADPPAGVKSDFLRGQLTANREKLEHLRTSLRGQGITVSHVVIDAAPAVGIVRSAEELNADLVCIGTHGYTGFDRVLLGSVAERVVRDCKRAVLIAREAPVDSLFRGYHRILVPTDFSESAELALALAARLLAKDGTIDLRHFWHTPIFGPIADPATLRAEEEMETSERGADAMAPYEGKCSIRFSASRGNPKREILDLLDRDSYDLLAMGSHGRRGLGRWLLGSVAEAVARHASCSVLVAKQPR